MKSDETKKLLQRIVAAYYPNLVISCSFAAPEGMVIIDMLQDLWFEPPHHTLKVCTIDTGRLPQATYDLIDKFQKRYKQYQLDIIYPESDMVQNMTQHKGVNLFYDSVENRKECCNIRKVVPFDRYLEENNIKGFIAGLRQEHSKERRSVPLFERLDKSYSCVKINPLYDWTKDEVMAYVKERNVPTNKLHSQGYESIGCEPCTRPGKGRTGRWWWERDDVPKECGLHEEKGSGI